MMEQLWSPLRPLFKKVRYMTLARRQDTLDIALLFTSTQKQWDFPWLLRRRLAANAARIGQSAVRVVTCNCWPRGCPCLQRCCCPNKSVVPLSGCQSQPPSPCLRSVNADRKNAPPPQMPAASHCWTSAARQLGMACLTWQQHGMCWRRRSSVRRTAWRCRLRWVGGGEVCCWWWWLSGVGFWGMGDRGGGVGWGRRRLVCVCWGGGGARVMSGWVGGVGE